MINKLMYGILVGLMLTISPMLQAATTSEQPQPAIAQPVSIPANLGQGAVTFSPNIWVGSYSKAAVQNGNAGKNLVGAFTKPGLEVGFKSPSLNANIYYTADIKSARAFGAASGDDRYFNNNTSIEHNPVLKFSGGLSDRVRLNGLVDFTYHQDTTSSGENFSQIILNPDVEYRFTPSLALSVGYLMDRTTEDDSTAATSLSFNSENKAKHADAKAALASGDVSAFSITGGGTPYNTIHAGVITGTIKLTDDIKLVTLARAGKRVSNQAKNVGYHYRYQADFKGDFSSKLSGMLRYRLNVEDRKLNFVEYYNRAHADLGYALAKDWEIHVENAFTVYQSTKAGVRANYENENWAGVMYKF